MSKAYNKSQKDLTADSVHAPRTSCAACRKARLLEGSIYDVLTLVLKMSKQVLWCAVAAFHTISVKPWTFHHSDTILQTQQQPPQKISTFGPHMDLRQGAMMVCMVWWQKFVKMVEIFLYRLYSRRCIWTAISFLVCFVSSDVRVTKKCILYFQWTKRATESVLKYISTKQTVIISLTASFSFVIKYAVYWSKTHCLHPLFMDVLMEFISVFC